MSEGPADGCSEPSRQTRFGQLIARARQALALERTWPLLWLPLAVVLLFLALSWFGLWLDLGPRRGRSGVGLFVVATCASFWPLTRLRRPSRSEVLGGSIRIAVSGIPRLMPLSIPLPSARGSGNPRPVVAPSSPCGGRHPHMRVGRRGRICPDAIAMLCGRWRFWRWWRAPSWRARRSEPVVTPPSTGESLGSTGPSFRIDGWVDPPLYTRAPPVMIDLAKNQTIRAPIHSRW